MDNYISDLSLAIRSFSGPYRFLSNFYPARILIDSRSYPTVEHGFAAMKTLDDSIRGRIAALAEPGMAKRAGRTVQLRPDWDAIRVTVMRRLVRAKFQQHPDLAQKLVATNNYKLIEGNDWGDRFWGVDNKTGLGENQLGKVLELIRSELA